jgi:phenylpropionate dioxygenase-like ring-hydroxylating dioxygenase large terminal subunit
MDNIISCKRKNLFITRELLRRFPWLDEEIDGLYEEIKSITNNRPFIEASFLKQACVQSGYVNKLELEVEQNEFSVETIQEQINLLNSLKHEIKAIFYKLSQTEKMIVQWKYYTIDKRWTNMQIAKKLNYSKQTILGMDTKIVESFSQINKYKKIL